MVENEIIHFKHEEFGEIRTMNIGGEPWFVGKDITSVLGYKDNVNALKSHVDEEDKLRWQITTSGQRRDVMFINESGLYSLILSSKLPNAKKFKRWVTAEVLPSLRKNGAYFTAETLHKTMSDPRELAKLLTTLADEQDKRRKLEAETAAQKQQIVELLPKAEFADKVASTEDLIDVGEFSKLLHKKHSLEVGRTRLFAWLIKKGFLQENNEPYQRWVDRGVFRLRENVFSANGKIRTSTKTFITGSGQQYLAERISCDYTGKAADGSTQ